jgi:hypothetical protein
MLDFGNFLFPCMLMGFGIAIDVMLATTAKFRDRSLNLRSWTLPIMGTHIVFPAFGYYVFWGLTATIPALDLLWGVIGFGLVALFVYEVVCESIGFEPIFGISSWFSSLVGLDENDSRRFVAILAVSWDALWSGPAKAAQATAGHWTNYEVFVSFFIAGTTVAVFAQTSLWLALALRKMKFENPQSLAQWNCFGKWVELSVIGGFGFLSLWEGARRIVGEGSLYASIAIAAVVIGLVFLQFRKGLMANELAGAEEAVAAIA